MDSLEAILQIKALLKVLLLIEGRPPLILIIHIYIKHSWFLGNKVVDQGLVKRIKIIYQTLSLIVSECRLNSMQLIHNTVLLHLVKSLARENCHRNTAEIIKLLKDFL